MSITDIKLIKTSSAFPEQYLAVDSKNRTIGHMRLKHKEFRVECPDLGGKVVFSGNPDGQGAFREYERQWYLDAARGAIVKFYNEH